MDKLSPPSATYGVLKVGCLGQTEREWCRVQIEKDREEFIKQEEKRQQYRMSQEHNPMFII